MFTTRSSVVVRLAAAAGRTVVVLALSCLAFVPAALAGDRRPREERPSAKALRFFEQIGRGESDLFLQRMRPAALATELRARVMADLPTDGAARPFEPELKKLAYAEPVVRYHARDGVLQLKLISVGYPFLGLHARTVILVSREALSQLSGPELQGLVAHEVGHDYFWEEYAAAVKAGDEDRLRELELRCDGIAVLTLRALGVDPRGFVNAITRLTGANERLGAPALGGSYTSLEERIAFIEAMDRLAVDRSVVPVARNPQ